MNQISYASIHPMIVKAEDRGRTIQVGFQCPVSGKIVESSATVVAQPTMAGNVKNTLQRSLMYQLRSSVFYALRSVFGSGVTGRVVSDVAYGAIPRHNSAQQQQAPSEADRQAAIVEAFKRVAHNFTWDASNNRWVSAETTQASSDPLSEQINRAPLTLRYDQGVMARMIIEIARADGQLAQEERAMLTELIPPELGTLQEIAAKPALNPIELDEASQGPTRETMLLFAWAVALTDEELAQAESQRLAEFAQGLGLGQQQADAVKHKAQEFILSKAMERVSYFGYDDNASREVQGVAQRIGMSPEQAQRTEIRLRKARGLF